MPGRGTMPLMDKSEPGELTVEKLFSCLYERYYKKAFEYAINYCGTKQVAEDVAQYVFLKVWENLHVLQVKIKDWYAWRSFLFVLVRNRASNLQKASNKEAAFSRVCLLTASGELYDDAVLEKEYNRIFEQAVEELAYRQKEIFVLKYYRFKPKIIARELYLSVKTVSNTLVTARKLLHDNVNRQFEIDEAKVKLANTI